MTKINPVFDVGVDFKKAKALENAKAEVLLNDRQSVVTINFIAPGYENEPEQYKLYGPAEPGRDYVPAEYNGKPIDITKNDAIRLLVLAAAKNAYAKKA